MVMYVQCCGSKIGFGWVSLRSGTREKQLMRSFDFEAWHLRKSSNIGKVSQNSVYIEEVPVGLIKFTKHYYIPFEYYEIIR